MKIRIHWYAFKKREFAVILNDDRGLIVNLFGIGLIVKKKGWC